MKKKNMIEHVQYVFQHYADFSGRAQRAEFWYFTLFYVLTVLATNLFGELSNIVRALYLLVIAIPSVAVTVRRLHDIGKSGWWYLIILVPIVGTIVLVVFSLLESEKGENEYGANPKDIAK